MENMPHLTVEKLSPGARLPTKGDGQAGYHFYSDAFAVLAPKAGARIPTGISMT